jgi:hypothetical protein
MTITKRQAKSVYDSDPQRLQVRGCSFPVGEAIDFGVFHISRRINKKPGSDSGFYIEWCGFSHSRL